ncbi:hypothetical protein [Gordonia shandongensis]|uniref:hypothetical protein n=1 Tax=Gordonia shandongensis TaxID=376351 RepID=UPI0003F60E6D|nr:hypothetical protein [Gordonia shandongensis]
MGLTVYPFELDGFDALPMHSRRCVFWELGSSAESPMFDTPAFDSPALDHAVSGMRNEVSGPESEFDKEAWLSGVMLEWGACCQVAVEPSTDRIVGAAFYAPPSRVPRARRFPTAPVGTDAVLLTTITMEPGFETEAIHVLDAVVIDLVRRGVRAIEAFGFSGEDSPLAKDLATLVLGSGSGADMCHRCLLDRDFLTDAGFEIVADDPYLPRLRLELDEGLGWKSQVERALRKLVDYVESPMPSAGRPQPVSC